MPSCRACSGRPRRGGHDRRAARDPRRASPSPREPATTRAPPSGWVRTPATSSCRSARAAPSSPSPTHLRPTRPGPSPGSPMRPAPTFRWSRPSTPPASSTPIAALLGVDHDELGRLALDAEPGAGGLVLQPYFEGERTPNLPDATATLFGMTLASTTREGLARAAIEGMLCGLADGLDAVRGVGVEARRILLIGGAAQNPAVASIAAQVFDVPVVVPAARRVRRARRSRAGRLGSRAATGRSGRSRSPPSPRSTRTPASARRTRAPARLSSAATRACTRLAGAATASDPASASAPAPARTRRPRHPSAPGSSTPIPRAPHRRRRPARSAAAAGTPAPAARRCRP